MIAWTLVLLAALVAFANGANDNFKGVATLHGSGALPYRRALAWATLTTLAGSLLALVVSAGLVARFSGKGLVSETVAAQPAFLLAVAAGVAGTVLLATRLGFPISTTHALTGALVGAAIVLGGPSQISYRMLGAAFLLPLLLSPVVSLLLAAGVYAALHGLRLRGGVSEQTCVCVGGVEQLATYVPGAGAVRLASGLTVAVDSLERCERRYSGHFAGISVHEAVTRMHVLSGGAVGFARGLNDAPKIAALLLAAGTLGPAGGTLLVAIVMGVAGLVAARQVARTLSFGITGMNHGQAFSANLVTAVLVTLASPLGLPVSTTHVSCGALFGIGAASGAARWRTIAQILAAWVITLPCGGLMAAAAAGILHT
jgi:PiT family inorganic phosphate transporter